MKIPWLALLAAALPLALPSPAHGATRSVSWTFQQVGYTPAGPERLARGPERLAAGPGGLVAFWDPVWSQVHLLSDLQETARFAIPRADGLAFTDSGRLVVLDQSTRTVSLWTREGRALDAAALPDLVPQGGLLVVEGEEVQSEDVFGNRHRVARVDGDLLLAPEGRSLEPRAHTVRWQDGSFDVDGQTVRVGQAITAGARLLGDRWLVVDRVTGDHPVQVARQAIDLHTDQSVDLPVDGRAWVPRQDLAVDDQGRLLYLDPTQAGLVLVEVTP